jgi:hypothetical protein
MLPTANTGLYADADDLTVEGNTLVGATVLVDLAGDDLLVEDNRLDSASDTLLRAFGHGLEVVDNEVENTVLDYSPYYGIQFGGDDALVEDNRVDGYDWAGIRHAGGAGAEVGHNVATSTGTGAGVWATDGARVHNTTVDGGSSGISTDTDTDGATVENVTVTDVDTGLAPDGGDGSTWTHVNVSGYADAGMHVDGAENVSVRHSNFDDTNGTALRVEDTDTTVDARDNWWGCPDGPEDGDCDDVVGDAVVEPWLTEENGEAGAAG